MSDSSHREPPSISLEQLVALNDEIIALTRAGVPLGRGLIDVGYDLPGRLGRYTQYVGQRLEAGESLPAILAQDADFPPGYHALVTAGLRSGRLPAAMEGISSLIRRGVETRRLIVLALIYPIFILVVAYGLFCFTITKCFPPVSAIYHEFSGESHWLRGVDYLARHAETWALALPVVIVAVAVVVWKYHTQLSSSGLGFKGRWLTLSNMMEAGRIGVFAETLALLTEHDVPLDESLPLAAQISGNRHLTNSATQLSEKMRRGELLGSEARLPGTPPMLSWLLTAQLDQERLVKALRRVGRSYRRRAEWMTRWLSLYLPIWLTVIIGGTTTILYAAVVFVPWAHLLYELALP